MFGELVQRHLMGAPGAFHRLVVDRFRAGPALGTAQDQHGPGWTGGVAGAGGSLDGGNAVQRPVQCVRHGMVHRGGVVAGDDHGGPAVAGEQGQQLGSGMRASTVGPAIL